VATEAGVVELAAVSDGIEDVPEPTKGGETELEVALLIGNGGNVRVEESEFDVEKEELLWLIGLVCAATRECERTKTPTAAVILLILLTEW
jgi:hypothetical protein